MSLTEVNIVWLMAEPLAKIIPMFLFYRIIVNIHEFVHQKDVVMCTSELQQHWFHPKWGMIVIEVSNFENLYGQTNLSVLQ